MDCLVYHLLFPSLQLTLKSGLRVEHLEVNNPRDIVWTDSILFVVVISLLIQLNPRAQNDPDYEGNRKGDIYNTNRTEPTGKIQTGVFIKWMFEFLY